MAFVAVLTGDRYWHDRTAVKRVLSKLRKRHKDLLVISGGAPGLDTIAKEVCLRTAIPFFECPAPWKAIRNGAGPVRNGWMLKYGNPDVVIWFHHDLGSSKGTKNMRKQAREAGVKTMKWTRV